MRTLYIVTYDIADDRRWRKVFKLMYGYGDRLQYSVFRCALSDRERVMLMEKLARAIHHTEDQVLFFPLGPVGGVDEQRIYAVGRVYPPLRQGAVIV
ncbi:CRISPR-associated endonuclease Cas2 [Candidatus Roseilinea sp. NK_OTU-006]|jgi:CRISPR-associated protein Cas2|nr:CRISPR-associated endonuclease Cas2 [Candidatus Roseilinea sp. NK_OTU-006]